MSKVVIYTRFNRVFAENDHHRNRILKSRAWWKNRYDVMQDTLMRSLEHQTDKDFEFRCVFNDYQYRTYSHIKEFADKVPSYIEKINETTEYEPIELMADTKEDAIFFNVDSDDHIREDTVAKLKPATGMRVSYGLTVYMDKGYIYDLKTKKLAHYSGNGTPPPFWGLFIPGNMDHRQTVFRYMKDFGMNGHHYQKHKATNSYEMESDMYLYSIHSKNTTNAWKNPNTAKHVGETIRAKKKILERFGYV